MRFAILRKSSGTPPPYGDAWTAHSLSLFHGVDREVDTYGNAVHARWPVPGYPHLRLSRFLASFSDVPLTEELFVTGSQRLERWLFWPMGVPAGAMRERGHHASAFLGKRHFDDPQLLVRLFQPTAT